MFRYFPTFRNVGRVFRNNITKPGRTLLFLLFFTSIGLVYLETPLIFLFTAIISILAIAAVISFVFRPNLECRIVFPEVVQAGERVKADVYLRNVRRRSAFEVFFDPVVIESEVELNRKGNDVNIDQIAAGKTVRHSIEYTYLKRGVYGAPGLTMGSTFPFNLFRFRQHFRSQERTVVTPAFKPIQHFELPQSRFSDEFEDEKTMQMAHAAGASEYVGNREYQVGMPVRRWDYSSWARTGKPTVREFREYQRGSAVLFVDGFFGQATDENLDRFEAILSLTTALSSELAQQMIDICTVVIADRIHSISHSIGKDQVARVGELLAEATMKTNTEIGSIINDEFIQTATLQGSMAILVMNGQDANRKELEFRFGREASMAIGIVVDDQPSSEVSKNVVTIKEIRDGKVRVS